MEITFKEITKDNWHECIRLQVKEDQKDFIASNLYSIAESQFYVEDKPLAICKGHEMIGFVMYALPDKESPEEPEDMYTYWICRFMIDKKYQGKGHGKEAMEKIINKFKQEKDCGKICLSYEPENISANKFYTQLGFTDTGKIEDGEKVMELMINKDLF